MRATGWFGLVLLATGCHPAFGTAADGVGSRASADPAASDAVACVEPSQRHANGRLRQCELATDAIFGGQPMPAGSHITFGPDGVPGMAILSRASPVYGQPLPAGTVLHFAHGRLHHFWLPADTMVQGHLVRAQHDGAGAQLHPNGRLKAVWLVHDEVIDGIPCTSSGNVLRMGLGVIRLGTMRMAWFRPNGRLQQCMLSRDVTLDGYALRRGDVIDLDVDGHVDLSAERLSRW